MAEPFRARPALSEVRNLGPSAHIQVVYTSSHLSSGAAHPLCWPLRTRPKERHVCVCAVNVLCAHMCADM